MGRVRGRPLLSSACMSTINPLDLPVDAGAPVYFYEFQHRPQCLKDRKPSFVKADHTDEIRFVFGGAFLKGNIVMFGKKLAWGVPALAGTWNREKGIRRESPPLAWSLAHPTTNARAWECWRGGLNLWLTDTTFPWRMAPVIVLETRMKKKGQHLLDKCFCLD